MPGEKINRVIIDTNIWVSFLIGKKLRDLKQQVISKKIKLITTDQLLKEIELVSQRPHLRKYFPADKVEELIGLLQIIAENKKLKDRRNNALLPTCEQNKWQVNV